MQDNPWKQLDSEVVYQTAWMTVRKDRVILPNGKEGEYSYISSKPAVFVVALTQDNKVYLTGQWRYPTNSFSWELPGGSSDGEEFEQAARRELKEETGLEAASWEKIGVLQSFNGLSDELFYVFIARNLQEGGEDKRHEEAILEVKTFSWSEIWQLIKEGVLCDSQTISALTKAALILKISIEE